MVRALFKHRLFLSGFLFVFLLVVASVVHSVFFDGTIPRSVYHYNDQGILTDALPLSPAKAPPLGTDLMGSEMLYKLLMGAKYTIGIAVIAGALRIAVSFILGMFYGNFLTRFSKYVAWFVNSFYYLPVSLLCYVLLHNMLLSYGVPPKFEYSFVERAGFEFFVLTLVALPTTSLLIGNQIQEIYKNEFITGVKTLGGSRLHILRKHVLPHLWPSLLVQFVQQIVQVLVLLIHLGLFKVLFGGTKYVKGYGFFSVSSEWSGILGNSYDAFYTLHYWIPLEALGAFTFTILAFNFIVKGLEDVLLNDDYRLRKKGRDQPENDKPGAVSKEPSFEFVRDRAL